jgi:hypothetical protein
VFHHSFGIEDGQERGDIREIYPEVLVERLCKDHGIRREREVAALWDFLSFGATIYFVHKTGRDTRPPTAPARKQLTEIAGLAQKLSAKLAKLDERTRDRLWAPEHYIGIVTEAVGKTEHGLTIQREDLDDRSYRLFYLERADITEAVSVLGNYARYAAERLPPDKRGAKSSFGLWMWVANAQSFWTKQLARSFTYDRHGSDAISPAFRFCRDALAPQAPDVPLSILGTMMRKAITLERRRTGKNSVGN